MKKLRPSSQYKKDYKRFRRNPKKVENCSIFWNCLKTSALSRKKIDLIHSQATMRVTWNAILKEIFF